MDNITMGNKNIYQYGRLVWERSSFSNDTDLQGIRMDHNAIIRVITSAPVSVFDRSKEEFYQYQIIFKEVLNIRILASVFASMSVRGETAETFREALDFLNKE